MSAKTALGLIILCAGCRGAAAGATFQKSLRIVASAGGTLTVAAQDDPQLAGASLTIPAGALLQDTTVTIGESPAAVALAGTVSAGPVVAFGPVDAGFRAPVTLGLPLALSMGSASAQAFVVGQVAPEGTAIFRHAALALSASTVGVEALSLGTFGAVAGPTCAAGADCPSVGGLSQVCLDQACSGGLPGGAELGCGLDSQCLPGETCDAGSCAGGFDGGSSARGQPCLVNADCPQTPLPETCAGGVCGG